MKQYLTIGEFGRVCGLTKRQLRNYDRTGILVPAHVDPDTRYRRYGLDQLGEAATICMLRSLDVPLKVIADIVSSANAPRLDELLECEMRRIESHIARQRHVLLRLEACLARGTRPDNLSCELRDVPEQAVVSLFLTTPRRRVDDAVSAAMTRLQDYACARGSTVTGREFTFYLSDVATQDDFDVQVCLPTADLVDGDGDIRGVLVGGCRAACARHHGPFEDLLLTYAAMASWIRERGLEPVGPCRETYEIDERDTDDPRMFVTEIMWAVRPG